MSIQEITDMKLTSIKISYFAASCLEYNATCGQIPNSEIFHDAGVGSASGDVCQMPGGRTQVPNLARKIAAKITVKPGVNQNQALIIHTGVVSHLDRLVIEESFFSSVSGVQFTSYR